MLLVSRRFLPYLLFERFLPYLLFDLCNLSWFIMEVGICRPGQKLGLLGKACARGDIGLEG